MNAKGRANARWEKAPRQCPARKNGLTCNRDEGHTGRHYNPGPEGRGYWGSEFRDLDGPPDPRLQFCDLDWQDRFDANPDAPVAYYAYEVGRDVLLTVGPLGTVHLKKHQVEPFLAKLRKWADGMESYMKDYEG